MLRGVAELRRRSNLPRLSFSMEVEILVSVDPVDACESSDEAIDMMPCNHIGRT